MRAFRNKVRSGLGATPLDDPSETAVETREPPSSGDIDDSSSVSSDDENVTNETAAQKILRAARNKYIERGITGTISLTRQRGIVTHSLSCEVSEEDLPERADDDLGDLGRMDMKMISMFGTLLNQLEKAAKAWEGHPYAHKATIGRSSELGFYLPIFITTGFRIEIALEADVSSLVRSRLLRRRQRMFRDALKTVNPTMVEGVMQQGGFPLVIAQKAVISVQNSSVEDALVWAVSKTPAEIAEFQAVLSGAEEAVDQASEK